MATKGYRDLEVYQLSFRLAVEVDKMTKRLPKHEMYEEGSQVRRSAKSIPSNIAEGYGRRRYKADFIRFIIYALSSCDETRVHLDILCETDSLNRQDYNYFIGEYDKLGRKLNNFLQAVIRGHKEPYRQSSAVREPAADYDYLPGLDNDNDDPFIEAHHHHLHDDPPTADSE
ncbi:MAG: four helix bundle protein [Chloroflexota bacterium]|nr:four helix bundle protein [Chloroflexota bacterium]